MMYGAIDLHRRHSQVRVVDAAGRPVLERRIETTAERFTAIFRAHLPMCVLLESSTESEWVAQCIEACGHEVIVADPNYLAMYASRTRRIKTDRRDVAALAEACRLGVYRRAHRVSADQRRRRQRLRIRRQIIQMRTQLINVLRATLRQEGLQVRTGHASTVLRRLADLSVPAATAELLTPITTLLTVVEAQATQTHAAIEREAARDPVVRRLQTVPGVGPVVALTFHATLDTPTRFGGDARRAAAFVGVVPSERSSGDKQHTGRITKLGSRELRAMLVQASWAVWRSRSAAAHDLRRWVQALAARRGRRIAIVALARRLVRILFAVWRDGTTFVRRAAPTGGGSPFAHAH